MGEPLTCKEIVELVTEYLEGTLPAAVRSRMDEHLAGCEGCTNYLEQMRVTIRLTGALREQDLSARERADLLRLFGGWSRASGSRAQG